MPYQPSILVDEYRKVVDEATIDRIYRKADAVRGLSVMHMNSTYYAGGVVEMLLSVVTMLNQLGIPTEWRLLRGTPEFYEVTREMHEAIQGGPLDLTEEKKKIYEQVIAENAGRNIIEHDFVYMHDHHTMAMVEHYRKRGPWIWRCHLDLTAPNPDLIDYLRRFAEQYDAMVCILDEYKQDYSVPQFAIMPAIDPFTPKNKEMSEDEVLERLKLYDIPTDLPIVTQISRFDQWKDPLGVYDAFKQAQKEVDATLVFIGNKPSDDPEKNEIIDILMERQEKEERVIVLTVTDDLLVNALQRHATVVVQKSLREGFGLTVSEALWKGSPVIGGNAGGIPYQIDHGVNGFLVNSPEETGQRIVELVSNPDKARAMGRQGREKVRNNFLMTRLLEQQLTLLGSFKAHFTPVNMS